MLLLDIPMTLGCHESSPLRPEVRDADVIAETISRQDKMLDDIDGFTEWLSGECYHANEAHCRIGYVPRDKARRQSFIDVLDVPQLVSAMLYPDAELSAMAVREIRTRYLKHHGEA